ncbi:glycosyltransferase [Halogranum rubrum]|uniref:glycosyltransferase n=1 Tax=Halogranum rubrum TaxID=553466 RepID=UPI0012FBF4D2|nr:glycosyltransferase [Halogranum salarium]
MVSPTDSDPPLDVLFLPYYDDNPYQQELRAALNDQHVTVRTGDHEAPLPLLQSVVGDRPDVLHLHWAHSLFVMHNKLVTLVLGLRLLFELTVCKLMGVPIVWTVHNTLDHERRHPLIELTVRRVVARLCDGFITHGKHAREEVIDVYDISPTDASRVAVVPHGNYIGSYPDDVSRREAREALSLPDDATVYLHFGNIRPYKGVTRLVETFGEMDDPDSHLLLAGRPPTNPDDRARLFGLCERTDRVHTNFGFVPDDEIQHYFAASDAVVLPFERVLTSGSAVLAMSFGRPVVAPRMGCLPDTLSEKNDLLYDSDDPEGLRRQMQRVRDEDLSAVGSSNRIQAIQNDWGTAAERTYAVYRAAECGVADVAVAADRASATTEVGTVSGEV